VSADRLWDKSPPKVERKSGELRSWRRRHVSLVSGSVIPGNLGVKPGQTNGTWGLKIGRRKDCSRGRVPLGPLWPFSIHQQFNLSSIPGRDLVAPAASGFVAFRTAHLDGWPFCRCGFAIDESLVPGRQVPTPHANGVEFVHLLGYGEKVREGPEGLSPKIHIGTGHDDSNPAIGQSIGYPDNPIVQELGLVDGDHFGVSQDRFRHLEGAGHRQGFCLVAIM
jgi:hypothetical protein